ncbi:cupin domain-containing protein [Pleionea sp. CnH1-48]|uniref:cupin domain-containing protein n=1 Tax=Pleionea sp. CnH1-48 TaxID=2954494 RepID=UPI0020980DC1|nr:cupin domain-containing protein [Pleionea sp. CnH1-48]MCO7222786.1 cupin domain-containing protein [Pleionea sp. CnH1-48]
MAPELFSFLQPIRYLVMTVHALGSLSPQQFLNEYWQKKPLVIRQAFSGFKDFLSPEELAGLALEEDVEARLIQQEDDQWQVQCGPLEEEDFLTLPESHWTLLVQTLEHWLPEVKELQQAFSFLPDWRHDDVMVSYATQGGGVGPHIDQYDVFLIQGQGKRHWRVGEPKASIQEIRPHPDLKQIADFDAIIDVVLEPGDLLYIPPQTAHDGIAIDASMTYSIGFRAPDHNALLSQLLLNLMDSEENHQSRYSDKDRQFTPTSAQLDQDIVTWCRQALTSMTDTQLLTAFGQLVTRPKYEQEPQASITGEELRYQLQTSEFSLVKNGDSTFTYFYEQEQTSDAFLILMADGENHKFQGQYGVLIENISNNNILPSKELENSFQDIDFLNEIASLINRGCIIIKQD